MKETLEEGRPLFNLSNDEKDKLYTTLSEYETYTVQGLKEIMIRFDVTASAIKFLLAEIKYEREQGQLPQGKKRMGDEVKQKKGIFGRMFSF